MSEVVTELTIDATGAVEGGKQFEGAMDSAERAAQKTAGANNNLMLSIAGVSASVIAGIAGFKQGIDAIVGYNKQLADLQTMAKMVGLSLADIQGIQFGGQIAGLSTDQVNAGLQKSASLLNDAGRNANSLSKELEANGLSVKNANGQLISQNQLLGIAADLVKRAQNPGDQAAIAQMLGFTKEWIPLLEQGSSAMAGLTDEAKKAGAVIDDETIKKATDFDQQWRKSSVEFSTYMKAALTGLLPYVDDLIQRSAQFVKSIKKEDIEKAANDQLNALAGPVGAPSNDQAVRASLKFDVTPEAKAAIDDLSNATSIWQQIATVFNFIAANKPIADVAGSVSTESAVWSDGAGAINDTSTANLAAKVAAENATQAWIAEGAAFTKMVADVLAGAGALGDGYSKVAARGNEANDTVDRAINTLQRHNLQQEADAKAVGLGAGELARFRAEAAETAAVLANGGKETDLQKAKFEALKDAAFKLGDSLARVRINSQIDFQTKTAGMSSEDVAILQQLVPLYGNKIPEAIASTEFAQLKLLNQQKQLNAAFVTFGTDLVGGLLRGQDAMKSLTSAAQSLVQNLANQNLKRFLEGGSLFGSGNLNSAQGAVGIASAGISGYASGNPLTGALGGALAGAAFGPVGAAIGGIAGAVGGLLGQSHQAEEALAQAQATWKGMTLQVGAFNAAAAGTDGGPLVNMLAKKPASNDNQKDDRNDRDEHHQAA